MIGLCYMLVYLLKGGEVPFSASHIQDPVEAFVHIKKAKQDLSVRDLVGPAHSPSWPLLEFISQVFALRYEEEPNYAKYRILL